MSGYVALQATLGHFSARRHVAIDNALLLCAFTAVSAAVTIATTHLAPYVFP